MIDMDEVLIASDHAGFELKNTLIEIILTMSVLILLINR